MPEGNTDRAQVIAKHCIHRRVGNKIQVIKAGTPFTPQHDDEEDELRSKEVVFDNPEQRMAYDRASQGVVKRQKPGIVERAIPNAALRQEAALKANLLKIDGEGDGDALLDDEQATADANADAAAGGGAPLNDASSVAARRAARAKHA